MNGAQFIQAFPEFAETSPNLVASRLTFASAKMGGPDFTVWPAFAVTGQQFTLTDLAQAYLAAHLLQTSPFGTATLVSPTPGAKSPYLDEYESLALAVAGGFVVSGINPGTSGLTGASGSLVLAPGFGTVAVTNGSLAITFTSAQTMPAGTVLVFVGAQPGALYATAQSIVASTTVNLTAPYTGPTTAATSWNTGAG